MSDTSSSSSGLGFAGALTILFIALKLTGYVDWTWWWVLSPIWISTIAVVLVLGIILIATLKK
jgi:hypothetical protein